MIFIFLLFISTTVTAEVTKNVLFIPVDDLRPELFEAYGQTYVHTPNLDKLAKESLVFQRAYCQHALCIPSRNSFMTGKRPDTTKVWDGLGEHDFRITGPDWITLPEHFKNHGYTTLGGGKTYHPHSPPDWDEPKSWSNDQPYFPFSMQHCPKSPEAIDVGGQVTSSDTWCPLNETQYPDEYHYDYKLANHTIETLKYVNDKGGPWFVAAGFRRPHVPWMMPQRYWDMYNHDKIPTVTHRSRPKNSPDIAFHNQGVYLYTNGTKYLPMPNPFPLQIEQDVRHAYMASVTWVDSQIGRVLQTLDDMGISDNTLVVLFGDHGYQLGEHDSWHKQTNWELSARVPMMIRAPWKPDSQGKRSYELVELVDLYKTISDLVGTPKPTDDIEGTSFATLFDNFDSNKPSAKLNASFTQYPRCPHNASTEWDDNTCSSIGEKGPAFMGYSIRTSEWRYTAWMKWDIEERKAKWNEAPYAVELYDHTGSAEIENDFNQCETHNIADMKKDLVDQLHKDLKEFFDV